jgi:putative DNA primase/helicase
MSSDDSSLSPNPWPEILPPDSCPEQERQHFLRGREIRIRILNLLGQEAALVPIHPGKKIPVFAKHQKMTVEASRHPDLVISLGVPGRSVAVLLGEASHGLCTFDFDDQKRADEFLACNPRFAQTLTTTGARGRNFWFVLDGAISKSFDIRDPKGGNIMEFRGPKRLTIIAGTHPSGVPYRVLNDAKPIRVRWEEIVFPESWPKPSSSSAVAGSDAAKSVGGGGHADADDPPADEDPKLTALREKYGDPIYESQQGIIRINQQALAAQFCFAYPIGYLRAVGFIEYDPKTGVWLPREVRQVKIAIGDFIGSMSGLVGNVRGLHTARTDRLLSEVCNLVSGMCDMDLKQNPAAKDLLHLGNGMLDLSGDTPKLLPFDPDYLSMARVPHNYVPGAKCPRFRAFLEEALPADANLDVQKAAGMLLSKRNFAQKIFLLIGEGGAGKGTTVDVFRLMVGRENCVELRTGLLNQRFEKGRFIGKIMLVGPDVPSDFMNLKGAEALKSLTGGDVLDAELKNQNGTVALVGTYNVWMTANRNLRVSLDGDRGAWGRRLLIIRFPRKAVSVIPDLAEQLVKEEASGILNWMIEGLLLLKRDFAEQGRWVLSERQQALIDAMLDESDSICAFVRDQVERGDPQENSITTDELFRAYEVFCSDREWVPLSKMIFSKGVGNVLLDRFGVHPRHDVLRAGVAKRGYQGIKLRDPVPETDPQLRDLGEHKLSQARNARPMLPPEPYEPNSF